MRPSLASIVQPLPVFELQLLLGVDSSSAADLSQNSQQGLGTMVKMTEQLPGCTHIHQFSPSKTILGVVVQHQRIVWLILTCVSPRGYVRKKALSASEENANRLDDAEHCHFDEFFFSATGHVSATC